LICLTDKCIGILFVKILIYCAVEQQTNGLNGLSSGGVRQSQQQQQQQQHTNGLSAGSKTSIEAQTGRGREHMYGRLGSLASYTFNFLFIRHVRLFYYGRREGRATGNFLFRNEIWL
jgi:hypothetical protein